MSIAKHILKYFRGRPDYVAVPNGPGFKPHELSSPMLPEWLESEHLSGDRCLGFYLMTEENSVYCSAVDFDNKPESPDANWQAKAGCIYFELVKWSLTPLVEISQSGHAAHVWLFFDEPVPAYIVRQFWELVAREAEVPLVEVYPRQDELSGKGLGNLIRYPLFNHSQFVNAEIDWSELDSLQALEDIRTTDEATIRSVIYQISGEIAQESQTSESTGGVTRRVVRLIAPPHTLLGRRWRGDLEGLNDPSRSACAQSIACELVRQYVPTAEVESALRVWCSLNGYEKGARDDWIESTALKAYDFLSHKKVERVTTWTIRDAAREYVDEVRRGLPPCVATGIPELDRSIDGVSPGEVCVVAARPSHGKTAFAMQWVDSAARSGSPCLLISEEMSRRELGKRALLHISNIEFENWDKSEDRLLADIEAHYANRSQVFGLESVQNIEAVERLIDQYVRMHDVGVVAVDYLQLLSSDHGSRYDSVTDISRRLKQCATRNNVALIVLCQLNREIEKRDGHEPKLSDLRESGQIEQDADTVLMLQWPTKYDDRADPSEYRVYCSKRRNGPIRSPLVVTQFFPDRQKFGRVQQ